MNQQELPQPKLKEQPTPNVGQEQSSEDDKLQAARDSLGQETVKLVQMPDGSVATKADVEKWRGAGYNMNEGPYKGGVR